MFPSDYFPAGYFPAMYFPPEGEDVVSAFVDIDLVFRINRIATMNLAIDRTVAMELSINRVIADDYHLTEL